MGQSLRGHYLGIHMFRWPWSEEGIGTQYVKMILHINHKLAIFYGVYYQSPFFGWGKLHSPDSYNIFVLEITLVMNMVVIFSDPRMKYIV